MLCTGDTMEGWKHKYCERKECTVQVSVARISRRVSWCGGVSIRSLSMVKLMNVIPGHVLECCVWLSRKAEEGRDGCSWWRFE